LRRSIYARGMLLVGAFLAAVTIMITAWLAYDRNQELTAELENSLEDLTKLQAADVSDGVWNLNRDTVREILAATTINRDFHSARVITQNGVVFAEFPGLPGPAAQLLKSTAEIVVDDGGGGGADPWAYRGDHFPGAVDGTAMGVTLGLIEDRLDPVDCRCAGYRSGFASDYRTS
jgi:hypothetical protein